MMMDLTFRTEQGRFNFRVGALILHNGKALVVKNKRAPYYYSVGGRVKFNETTEEAVIREVKEETGIEMEVSRPVYFHESFYDEPYTQEHFHEIAVYYLMKDTDELRNIQCGSYTELGDAESLIWIPVDELHRYQLLPMSVFSELAALPSSMKHISERADNQ